MGKIIASMSARLEEIAATESKLAADVAADKAKFEHWEKELVTVSDAKDEALNAMNSADLDRQQLAGKHAVAEEAYMNYHEDRLRRTVRRRRLSEIAAVCRPNH